jgi:hypothetical protein
MAEMWGRVVSVGVLVAGASCNASFLRDELVGLSLLGILDKREYVSVLLRRLPDLVITASPLTSNLTA